MSILEILIASAMFLVMFSFLSKQYINFNKFKNKKEQNIGRLIIKTYINESADCQKTKDSNTTPCSDGSALEIVAADDSTVISKNSVTTIGQNYQVRAVCKNDDIDIQSRRVKNGTPLKDPLTGKIPGDNGWLSLYKDIPFHCSL